MKLLHFFAVVLLLGVLLSSCTIQQDINFNKDFSGKVKFKVDMSQMMALAGDEEGEEGSDDMGLDSLELAQGMEELNQQEGLSNAGMEMDDEKGIYTFFYDFANLDALNKAMKESDISSTPGGEGKSKIPEAFKYFTKKGKKINYQIPDLPVPDGGGDMEGMEGMGDMMRYELNLSFASPIKKFKNKHAKLSDDQQTLTIEGSLPDITSKKLDMNTQIKLK